MESKRPFGDLLLILRAFAGFVVVIIHVYPSFASADASDSLLLVGPVNLSWMFSGAGQAGVYLFFTLSGYLMGKGFATVRYTRDVRGALAFYWARFLRIYPLLVFYMIVMITLGRMNAPTGSETYATLGQMLLMQWHASFGESFPWFKHLWSIMTEVRFYVIVPLLAWFFARYARTQNAAIAWLVGFVIFGFVARSLIWVSLGLGTTTWPLAGPQWDAYIQQPLITNIDLFCAGMLLNTVVKRSPLNVTPRRIAALGGSLVAFYLSAAFVTHYALFAPNDVLRTFWAIGLPTCTLVFSLCAIVYCENLNAGAVAPAHPAFYNGLRFVSHLGTLTYGIYVWHLPFIALPLPFSRPFGPLPNLIIATVLTYGLAAMLAQVTYLGLELPFDRFKRLVPSRSRARDAAPERAAFREPATSA